MLGAVREISFNIVREGDREEAHYMVIGEKDAPNPITELLTGRISVQTALDPTNRDHNNTIDTILVAPEQTRTSASQDPMNRLTDVLTKMQNCPVTQQPLTIRPDNTTTMTIDGKREILEDLFQTIVEMHLEMSEQMKVTIHFYKKVHSKYSETSTQ